MTDMERKQKTSAYRHTYYRNNELSTNEMYADASKKGQKWTVKEQQFLIENSDMSRLELSRQLKRTCISIRNQQQRLGLLKST